MASDEQKLNLIPFVILKILNGNKGKPIKGKVLLQKLVFLITKNFPKIFGEFDFVAHRFGPYSAVIESITEDLEYQKHLTRPEKEKFYITPSGNEALEISDPLYRSKDLESFEEVIEEIKESFNDFTTNQMLAFIYKSYPDYVDPSNSQVADSLNYEEIFLQCYEEGKLGISKIAELMGWSYQEAYDFIQKNARRIYA
ncbi:MAG: hypothetical protein ACTSRC_20215 [Candidatus Helarchaeota archaeon]